MRIWTQGATGFDHCSILSQYKPMPFLGKTTKSCHNNKFIHCLLRKELDLVSDGKAEYWAVYNYYYTTKFLAANILP